MKSHVQYVAAFRDLRRAGVSGASVPERPVPAPGAGAPAVLLFSPHPDDECIAGGLALRLRREAGARVINVPMTFGSRADRRAARREELARACRHLGFDLAEPAGLEGVASPGQIASLLNEHRPRLICFPHAEDGNATHERVNRLVRAALPLADVDCLLAETEFWRPMRRPNAMVELSVDDLAWLVEALSLHAGEVARNPYHLSLPAWMMDNVRRGAEMALAPGGAAPDIDFATLYRVTLWRKGAEISVSDKGLLMSAGQPAGDILALGSAALGS